MKLAKTENINTFDANTYAAELSSYYRTLKREQRNNKRARELDYLGDILDRCSKLSSPSREQFFVDSILNEDVARRVRAA